MAEVEVGKDVRFEMQMSPWWVLFDMEVDVIVPILEACHSLAQFKSLIPMLPTTFHPTCPTSLTDLFNKSLKFSAIEYSNDWP